MASITTALAAPAEGNDNPTLDIHLLSVRDYTPGLQFLDIMKVARSFSWITDGGKMDSAATADYVDSDGWPTEMPEGVKEIRTIWQWGDADPDYEYRKGTYVVEYEGTGDLNIVGDVTILSQEAGRIVFESDGSKMMLNILDTDPEGTGD